MVKALQTRSSFPFRAPLLCLGWRQNRPGLPGILLGSDGLRSDPGFVVLVFLVRLDMSVCQSWGNAPTPPKSCCETEIDSPCKLLSSTAWISVLSISRGSDSCWGARRSRNSTLSWSSLPLSADNGDEHAEGGLVENHVDGTVNLLGGGGSAGRKPLKSGMKELAVFREKVTEQHRQMGKGGKHHLGLDEPKKLRPPPGRVRGAGSGWRGGRTRKRGLAVGEGTQYHPSPVLPEGKALSFLVLPLTYSVTFRLITVSFGGLSISGCERDWA